MLRDRWLNFLVILSIAVALLVWFASINQPLIDRHEFRQTQTALTTFFLEFDLRKFFNYETPVLGAPWSIPFEFPFYQLLVAAISRFSGLELSLSGRLINIIFGIACIWPALDLFRHFGFKAISQKVFLILYFLSPLYLYWNRSFMIEGAASFFTLLSLSYFFKIKDNQKFADVGFWVRALLFLVSLMLGLLVKATTALPGLLVMGLVGLPALFGREKTGNKFSIIISYFVMALAFLALYFWTNHANELKSLNPFGVDITSSALRQWNFGSLGQRFSHLLWGKVFAGNIVGVLPFVPALLILFNSWSNSSGKKKQFLALTISLSVLPIIIFANLHIVHDYYQAAAQVYFLMAVAASVEIVSGVESAGRIVRSLPTLVVSLYLVWDLSAFSFFYAPYLARYDSPKLDIGRYIKEQTDPDSAIIVFGDDWSSAFPYFSKRRALVRPDVEEEVMRNSLRYLGDRKLSAVVSSKALKNEDGWDGLCDVTENLFFPALPPRNHLLVAKLKELAGVSTSKGKVGSDSKSWYVYRCG